MERPNPPEPLRWLNSSLVRFMLVGGCGELLYFVLFMAASRAGMQTPVAIATAGCLCLLVNAVLHARISFRVRFRWRLLIEYLLIQGVGLLLALALGGALERQRVNTPLVGIATLLVWAFSSFLLTRWRFQRAAQHPG